MRKTWIVLIIGFALVLYSGFVQTQPNANTKVLTDASQPIWGASPDHAATFGTPPAPVITSYRGELWLKANVNLTTGPVGNPAITLDLGKPAQVGPDVTGPVLKPLIQPNTEYIMYVSAVGPGGVSARTNPSVPFGYPSAPRPAGSAVRLIP